MPVLVNAVERMFLRSAAAPIQIETVSSATRSGPVLSLPTSSPSFRVFTPCEVIRVIALGSSDASSAEEIPGRPSCRYAACALLVSSGDIANGFNPLAVRCLLTASKSCFAISSLLSCGPWSGPERPLEAPVLRQRSGGGLLLAQARKVMAVRTRSALESLMSL